MRLMRNDRKSFVVAGLERSFEDGFNLYSDNMSLVRVDPSGKFIMCVQTSAIAGFVGAISASCAFCGDTCGTYAPVCCLGGGAGAGASWGIIGGTGGPGCLTRKTGCLQGNIQGALPIGIGGGITLPGGWGPTAPSPWPPSSYGASIGPGAGIALTAEGCWTF